MKINTCYTNLILKMRIFFAGLTFYVEDPWIKQNVQEHSVFEQSEFEWSSF